jgi:hypothetical protein
MGDEFKLGILLRKVFTRLGDDDFDTLLRLLGHQSVRRTVSKHGDMDYPSRLLANLSSVFPGLKALSSLGVGVAKMGIASPDNWVRDVIAVLRASN